MGPTGPLDRLGTKLTGRNDRSLRFFESRTAEKATPGSTASMNALVGGSSRWKGHTEALNIQGLCVTISGIACGVLSAGWPFTAARKHVAYSLY